MTHICVVCRGKLCLRARMREPLLSRCLAHASPRADSCWLGCYAGLHSGIANLDWPQPPTTAHGTTVPHSTTLCGTTTTYLHARAHPLTLLAPSVGPWFQSSSS